MPKIFRPLKGAGMLLAVLAYVLVLQAASAPSQTTEPAITQFDGEWQVTIVCHEHTDDHVNAEGYTLHYALRIEQGVLHGQRLEPGTPGWMVLDGKIQPDGSAILHAKGLTNLPAYSLHHVGKATPYAYEVKAQFQRSAGTGSRIGGRVCEFTFAK